MSVTHPSHLHGSLNCQHVRWGRRRGTSKLQNLSCHTPNGVAAADLSARFGLRLGSDRPTFSSRAGAPEHPKSPRRSRIEQLPLRGVDHALDVVAPAIIHPIHSVVRHTHRGLDRNGMSPGHGVLPARSRASFSAARRTTAQMVSVGLMPGQLGKTDPP
jgi:hypothetical protein